MPRRRFKRRSVGAIAKWVNQAGAFIHAVFIHAEPGDAWPFSRMPGSAVMARGCCCAARGLLFVPGRDAGGIGRVASGDLLSSARGLTTTCCGRAE